VETENTGMQFKTWKSKISGFKFIHEFLNGFHKRRIYEILGSLATPHHARSLIQRLIYIFNTIPWNDGYVTKKISGSLATPWTIARPYKSLVSLSNKTKRFNIKGGCSITISSIGLSQLCHNFEHIGWQKH